MTSRCFAVIVLSLVAAVPREAFGFNETCPSAVQLLLNQVTTDIAPATSGGPGGASTTYFSLLAIKDRSYSVFVWSSTEPFPLNATPIIGVAGIAHGCPPESFSGVTQTDPGREPFVDRSGQNQQLRLITNTSGKVYFRVVNEALSDININVLAIETTLFSPWWFVGPGYEAYLTVRNNTVSAGSDPGHPVRVLMYDQSGAICGTQDIANVPANGNAFVRVGAFPNCVAAGSGSAAIAFMGTPGGMVANTTILNVSAGISFDEPFQPRMMWGTFR